MLPTNTPANPTNIRYRVLGFACMLSLLTYLDRVCISRVRSDIQGDLGFTDIQMGYVFSAFLAGYTLFEIPGGWMGDVWGSRLVIFRIVVWWSIFTALTGYIDSLLHLTLWGLATPGVIYGGMLAVRFLFGVGEAGAYPNLARVVRGWFPVRERAFALGFVWWSARMGGALAPIVIGWLSTQMGWRNSFVVLGGVGLVVAVVFYTWFRNRPEEVAHCNQAERDLIHEGKGDHGELAHPKAPWAKLFSFRLSCIYIAGFMVSFAWYIIPTWLPKYLQEVHGMAPGSYEKVQALTFFVGAWGALSGGRISDFLVKRIGKRWGRSAVGCFGFLTAGIFMIAAGSTTSDVWVIVFLCLTSFCNDLGIPPIWAAIADIGGKYTGTASGVLNTIGGVGGFLSPILLIYLLKGLPESWSAAVRWEFAFAMLGIALFLGALAWLGVDASKPIVSDEEHS